MKRREVKSKGEKERYTYLNAEFQKIAKRDKKAFLSDQCKKIEENNRMGKTRDLFKKFRDTKGTFHAKMGSIKWNCTKKDLYDPDNPDAVITHTHLEPDILECEVCQAPLSIGFLQARILKWVAVPSSRASSQPSD